MERPTNYTGLRRSLRFANTRLREWRMIARGLLSRHHLVLAHVTPFRRCNLSCAYCNEYDSFSKPVCFPEMLRRIDRLASFGTTIITLSGGETLLHPELQDIIRRIRSHGILAGLITSGYLLTPSRVEKLNRAGLDRLQISVDSVISDEVSKKSLKVLDQGLVMLARYAIFQVNINSVIGSAVRNPEDALVVAHRAVELGFSSTVGILHDHTGQLQPLPERQQNIFAEITRLGKRSYSRFNQFQANIAHGVANDWRCRASSRYLYICEDGLVHYCSQQRGFPAIPLDQSSPDIREDKYHTQKSCVPRCTVSCVQQVAMLDNWRDPQTGPAFERPLDALIQLQLPVQD